MNKRFKRFKIFKWSENEFRWLYYAEYDTHSQAYQHLYDLSQEKYVKPYLGGYMIVEEQDEYIILPNGSCGGCPNAFQKIYINRGRFVIKGNMKAELVQND